MKVLIATEKPFAAVAVNGIKEIFNEAGFEVVLLEKYTEKSELLAAVESVDAIIIRSDKVDAEVLDAAKNLKIVVRAGAGYDNVDLEAATAHGVVVMNTPGQNSNAVAELVVGMLLYAVRNQFAGTSGTELMGKKIGLMAFGAVSQNLARIAKGFGMSVAGYSPTGRPQKIVDAGCEVCETPEQLFKECDIVSLHIPSTPQTKKSIGYALLNSMPKGATIVNTARKEVIDEEGLYKALEERADLKYITDIAPDTKDALAEAFGKRFFATPKKMGAETAEANINAGLAAARQIVDYFVNGNTRFQVNK
jgi:D-3-phosphoglycerate dehydrogenase